MAPVVVTVSYDLNGGSVGGGAPGFTLYCLDGGDYAVPKEHVNPFTPSNPKYLEQASPKKDEKPLQYWESSTGVRMKYGDAFDLKALTKGLTSPDVVLKAIYDLPPEPPRTGDGFPLIPMAALACAAIGCILLITKRRA